MVTAYEAAQRYESLGFVCVPANIFLKDDGGKRVATPTGWQNRRFTDPEDWSGYTGVAFNCAGSGIVAVDIDVTNGKDGHAALAEAGIELPDTPLRARSRSGGEHRVYRAGTTAWLKDSTSVLAAGVDAGVLDYRQPAVSQVPADQARRRFRWPYLPRRSGVEQVPGVLAACGVDSRGLPLPE